MNFIKEYELYGFIQGDGDLGRLKSSSHKGIEINIGKKDLDICPYFNIDYPNGRILYYNTDKDLIPRLIELGFDSKNLPERELPKTFEKWNENEKKSFIRGLYSANGSFIKAGRIAFKTTSKILSVQLKEYLEHLELNPYITTNKAKNVKFSNGTYLCKESYDINLGRIKEVCWFYENIGFIQKYKMENILKYLSSKEE